MRNRLLLALLATLAAQLTRAEAPSKQAAPAPAPAPVETFAQVTGEDGKPVKVDLFGPAAASVAAAKVGDETITVEDVARALTSAHEAMAASGAKAGKKDFAPVLDRMIEVRLLVQEARAMGIADLPDIQASVAAYRESTLQELLKHEVTKDAKPDKAVFERQYRDATREWKIKSALFPKLEDVKAVQAAMASGKSFDEVIKKAVADRKAKGGEKAEFLPRDRMLPQVLAALEPMKKGAVSAPIKLADG
ncbi:MAG TPA: hypothetical protein VF770_03925, partial [Solirubrobacterales bacterium]